MFALALVFSAGFVTPTPAQAASLTSAQVSAIISLLQSFGADQSVINNVSVALGGTSSGSQSCSTFADLAYGNFDTNPGGRVSQLQTWLGISSNTFGFGTYGPKTRALWNSRCGGTTNSINFTAVPTSGIAPLTVSFILSGVSSPLGYRVDVGGEGGIRNWTKTPTGYQILYTYNQAGTYKATLLGCPSSNQNCDGGFETVGTATVTITGGTAQPVINLITPSSSSAANGATVTIMGSGLNSGLPGSNDVIYFTSSNPATYVGFFPTFVSSDGTRLTFNLPSTSIAPGTYQVRVSIAVPEQNGPGSSSESSNGLPFTVTQ